MKNGVIKRGRTKRFVVAAVVAAALCALCLAGCSSSGSAGSGGSQSASGGDKGTIVVGSKGFSESKIVSELYALALEDAGYTVDRQFGLNTNVLDDAVKTGDVDVYPEYTGTAYLDMLGHDPNFDKDQVYDTVKSEYADRGLVALAQSDINDTGCFQMLTSTAEKYGIKNVSDLQKQSPNLVWGTYTAQGSDERGELDAIANIYGPLNWKSVESIDASLTLSALDNGQVDVDEGLTTDPHLKGDKYTIVEEDIPCRVPCYLFPVVNKDYFDQHGDIEDVINNVSSKLNNDVIMDLVTKTDIDGEEYEDVAKDYYEQNIA